MDYTIISRAKFDFARNIERLLLDALADIRGSDLYFAQVGANDGQMNDPISTRVKQCGWNGILFEPVTAYYDKLCVFYKDMPHLTLVKGACGDADDMLEFHEVADRESVPHAWMKGLSSFEHNVVRKHFESDEQFQNFTQKRLVQTRPLNTYLNDNNVTRCDLVVIDTEGFELNVLKGFDAERYRTALVIMEHQHLSAAKRQQCTEILHSQGLTPAVGWFDTYFYRSSVFGYDIAELLTPFRGPLCAKVG